MDVRTPRTGSAPVLSLLLLVVVAAIKTSVTKLIFTKLPTPIAYSLLSSVVTGVLVAGPALCTSGADGECGGVRCVPLRELWMLGFVAVAVAVDLGLSNIAISLLPLPLQQAIASAIPAATILLESIVFRRLKPIGHYIAISFLCFGAVLGHLGSLPDQRSGTTLGELAMLTAVFMAATKYVFAKASIVEWKRQMGPLGLLLWIEVLIAAVLLPWAVFNGELALFVQIMAAREHRLSDLLALCACAALGGFRFFCELVVLKYWSATTLSATNLVAHSIIIVLAIPAFGCTATPALVAGTAATAAGAMFYAWLKMNDGDAGQTARAAVEEEEGFGKATSDDEGDTRPRPRDGASSNGLRLL